MSEGLMIPHMDQYAGVWAMEEHAFLAASATLRCVNLNVHVGAARGEREARAAAEQRPTQGYRGPSYGITEGGVAVIDLIGTMTKYGSSMSEMEYGTIGVRMAIRNAVKREDVRSILIVVDSPGGSVKGTDDLANEVVKARARKPVVAYIDGMGASAAYWVASQADEVWMNASGIAGSIGTYAVVYDYSGMYAQKGVKALVVRAGEYKGMGMEGTEVTEAQTREIQRTVDEFNAFFLGAVARGRGLSAERVAEIADGRVWIGKSAVGLGLVDRIGEMEEAGVAALGLAQKKDGSYGRHGSYGAASAGGPEAGLDSRFCGNDGKEGAEMGWREGAATGQARECVAELEPDGRMSTVELRGESDEEITARQGAAAEPITEEKTMAAASLAELKAALPGATPAFLMAQMEKEADVQGAVAEYLSWHQQELLKAQEAAASAQAEAATAKAEAESAAKARRIGVEPLMDGGAKAASGDGSAESAWTAAIKVFEAKGMTRRAAISAAVHEHKELHAAYLKEYNESRGRVAE